MEMGSAETLHQIHVERVAIEARCRPRGGLPRVAERVGGRGPTTPALGAGAPLKFDPDGTTDRFSARVATGKLIVIADICDALRTLVTSPYFGLHRPDLTPRPLRFKRVQTESSG